MRHLLLPLCVGLASSATADFDYPDFQNTSGLAFAGSASAAGGRARICPSVPSLSGAMWHTTRQDVVAPWTTTFTFECDGGADGMAFVIQRDSAAPVGGNGGSLGYDGIANSLAIELDCYANPEYGDPSPSHISIHSMGAGPNSVHESASLGSSSLVAQLDDATVRTCHVTYVPGALRVYVDDMTYPVVQVSVDLGSLLSLNDDTAWVGFTAATGGVWQNHFVDSWSFDEQATSWTGNQPPVAPTITEPETDGEILNPFDVHMETSVLSDPDGDSHQSSDFEIWLHTPAERVWEGHGLTGFESVHAHFGDGVFVGSHAGQLELWPQEAYVVRMRHVDDAADPWSSAGPWTERPFQTGAADDFYPLEVDDLIVPPEPVWEEAGTHADVVLPPGGPQPGIFLESPSGDLILSIEGDDGAHNHVTDGPELPQHAPLRVRIDAGSTVVGLPETDLTVVDHECLSHTILLPAFTLLAGQDLYLWVTADGSTWWGNAGQTEPDFSSLARGASLPWVSERPELSVEVVAEGLQLPVNVAFAPNAGQGGPGDPFLYITELYGTIKVMTHDGTLSDYATGLLNFNPTGNFPGSGEQGLTGIAVDPQTGDVYAAMLYDVGGPHYPKVDRFTSNDGGLTAATQTTILDMVGESQGQSHQISNLTITPDGRLFVHMGDGFNAGTAQDLNSFRGKILRCELDGSAVTSNPFYNAGNGITARDYVYAYGVRNPFAGAYREADGFQYEAENGPSVDRLVKVVPGHNYGWDGSNSSMFQDALYNWAPAHAPVNMTFLQQGQFSGSGFPANYMDRLILTESGPTYANGPQSQGKRLVEFVLDGAGNVLSGPDTLVEYVGTGRATAVGLAAGPDGLYFTELYNDQGSFPIQPGARLLRVSFDAGGDGCEFLGTSYCEPAVDNSTGGPGELLVSGSDHVADQDLTLTATHLPPNQFGYFLVSMTQAFTPNPGGSQGNLCLGGTIGRFVQQVQNSGPAGTMAIDVDVTGLPTGLGAIQPGDTWNFQCWYRDANPGATSNFTQGVEVDFH